MKIVFFGSPQFAVPSLQMLCQQQGVTVALVVTQPDKPAQRGQKLQPTPVKQYAIENSLTVLTQLPTIEQLKELGVELGVVVAYGRMIPSSYLEQWLFVNLHPSLLPKYRGPSPMQSALLNGDQETAVTTMLLSEAMDAGDILLQKKFAIPLDMDIEQLHDKCAVEGAELLVKTVNQDIGALRKPQDSSLATYCKKIEKNDSAILPTDDAHAIHNKVRAIGGFIIHNGKRVKICKTAIVDGQLILKVVQPEGKPKMEYVNFMNGYGEIIL